MLIVSSALDLLNDKPVLVPNLAREVVNDSVALGEPYTDPGLFDEAG